MATATRNQSAQKLCANILFLLLFSFSIIFAQGAIEEIPDKLISGQIRATINPTTAVCSDTPCSIDFNASITNPSDRTIKLFIAEKDGDNWRIILDIGSLEAKQTAKFGFTLNFIYIGQTTYIGQYAIISDTLLKNEFTIIESWEKYQDRAKDLLSVGGFIIAPIIAFGIIIILYFSSRIAQRHPYMYHPGEFTMENLYTIPTRGPLGERLALLLTNPILWAIILFFAFLLMGSLILITYRGADFLLLIQIGLISLVTASLIPVILMVITWYADLYEREPFRFVVGMFMWGVIAAFLAFFINGAVIFLFGQAAGAIPILLVSVFGSILVSPVIEEIVKAAGLSIMAQHHEFDDTLDGLLYGFAIGLGFATMENWFYFVTRVDPLTVGLDAWLSAILYRSFFNTVAHGCFTGFVGAIIGLVKSRKRFQEYFLISIFPGLFIAMILHIIFNFTAYLDIIAVAQYRAVIILFNPVLVVTVAVGFIAIYIFALIENRGKYTGKRAALDVFSR